MYIYIYHVMVIQVANKWGIAHLSKENNHVINILVVGYHQFTITGGLWSFSLGSVNAYRENI